METVKEKIEKAFTNLKETQGYKNPLEAPKIIKVVVSSGTGRDSKKDKSRNELVADRLAKITGQKPSVRVAKQSIATFKLREGDKIGYMVTLRGEQMYSFLDKLINIAIPRTKDFRGLKRSSIDDAMQIKLLKGVVEFRRENYSLAQNYLETALAYYTKTNRIPKKNQVLVHLGLIYRKTKQYKKAENALREAVKLSESISDSSNLGDSYTELGLLYFDLKEHYEIKFRYSYETYPLLLLFHHKPKK